MRWNKLNFNSCNSIFIEGVKASPGDQRLEKKLVRFENVYRMASDSHIWIYSERHPEKIDIGGGYSGFFEK